jgi:hypothetical protein
MRWRGGVHRMANNQRPREGFALVFLELLRTTKSLAKRIFCKTI